MGHPYQDTLNLTTVYLKKEKIPLRDTVPLASIMHHESVHRRIRTQAKRR